MPPARSLEPVDVFVMGLKMSVYLRGLRVRMTKPFRNLVKANAGNGELAGERVTENVWSDPFEFSPLEQDIKCSFELVPIPMLRLSVFIREEYETLIFLVGSKEFSQSFV